MAAFGTRQQRAAAQSAGGGVVAPTYFAIGVPPGQQDRSHVGGSYRLDFTAYAPSVADNTTLDEAFVASTEFHEPFDGGASGAGVTPPFMARVFGTINNIWQKFWSFWS